MICALNVFSPNLGHWVKRRNTTWLSKFLLTKFDEDKWVESFHTNKSIVFNITKCLKPCIQKQDTKYNK
jgi:hypothetical protein